MDVEYRKYRYFFLLSLTTILWDRLHQSLAQLIIVLVNLSPPLIDYQHLVPSNSFAEVLLLPPDPFFLSVNPRSLDTFMLQSANWNMMIPSIWARSKYAGVSCGPIAAQPSLHYKYLAPSLISEVNSVLKIPTITVYLRVLLPFCTYYTLRVACK